MRLIKTLPRYHCDFCSHTATQGAMERHERICWLNPNRHCESCNDTGFYPGEAYDELGMLPGEPCYYCSKRDPAVAVAR